MEEARATEAMMQLNPHLAFNGQCEAAFKFYEKCLGGNGEVEIPLLTHTL
jgi:uncharacterized glyoxalase superfamily protein PhnB